jgi:hypothetical protein
MRIPELQRILVEGARRQEQPVRRTLRIGRRPLALAAGVLALGGSAAAAVVSLGTSRPLSGSVPNGVGIGQVLHRAGATQYRVSVFPYLAVGWSGWCSSVEFSVRARPTASAYGCGPVESSRELVLDGATFGGPKFVYEYEILSDRVAAVHYSDGPTVTPISDPRLPRGTRAVVRIAAIPRVTRPDPPPFPRETWLDARGRVLPRPVITRANAVEHLPLRTLNPRHPAGHGCAVRAQPLGGLLALTQTVVTAVPWPRREAGAFLACANAHYRLGTSMLAVAVLVDATNPHRLAPPLPGLLADPRHPGILIGSELGSIGFPQGLGVFNGGRGQPFDTPTAHQALANHDVSARRAAPGWLVAEGGTATERATLLAALRTAA